MPQNEVTVVFEPEIDPHSPGLYSASHIATGARRFSDVTDEDVQQYSELGFLVIEEAFPADEIGSARDEMARMLRSDYANCRSVYFEGGLRRVHPELMEDSQADTRSARESLALGVVRTQLPQLTAEERVKYVRKFMGFVDTHPPLAALAYKPELLALCARLIGKPIKFYQDMAMIKPPGGREKPWHQDHAYFNLQMGTRVVGVWVALDDTDTGNGCMHVFPGEHKNGPRAHFRRRDWQICDDEVLGRPCCALPMKSGGCVLFDALLPHGTPTNYSDRHRWAIQFHYVEADARAIAEEDRMAVFGSEGKDVSC